MQKNRAVTDDRTGSVPLAASDCTMSDHDKAFGERQDGAASLDEAVAMNRVLLYASDDKLKASQGPPGWLDRLDLSLTVGPPGVSVGAGLRAHEVQVLQVMVDKADRTIRKQGVARSLADSVIGRPSPLFTFEGPPCWSPGRFRGSLVRGRRGRHWFPSGWLGR
jgi:hypothetical protein